MRLAYKTELARIGAWNEQWIRDGVSLLDRARRAFEIRRHARLAARR